MDGTVDVEGMLIKIDVAEGKAHANNSDLVELLLFCSWLCNLFCVELIPLN